MLAKRTPSWDLVVYLCGQDYAALTNGGLVGKLLVQAQLLERQVHPEGMTLLVMSASGKLQSPLLEIEDFVYALQLPSRHVLQLPQDGTLFVPYKNGLDASRLFVYDTERLSRERLVLYEGFLHHFPPDVVRDERTAFQERLSHQ